VPGPPFYYCEDIEMSAHLCVRIDVRDSEPKVLDAAIYSESAESLTTYVDEHYAELFNVSAPYAEGREEILSVLRGSPRRWGWLYRYFEELK
jgi:hypothetical protein